MIVEVGGTVGDIECLPFLEAIRQMQQRPRPRERLLRPRHAGAVHRAGEEMKTKPTQHSRRRRCARSASSPTRSSAARSGRSTGRHQGEDRALLRRRPREAVISRARRRHDLRGAADARGRGPRRRHGRALRARRRDARRPRADWRQLVERIKHPRGDSARSRVVGKYVELPDAYISVTEALRHAGIHHDVEIDIRLDRLRRRSTTRRRAPLDERRRHRGARRLRPSRHRGQDRGRPLRARATSIPYLGLCLGMQCAVIEFARDVLGRAGRQHAPSSTPFTPHPVIDLMPEQRDVADMGGTMRLGAVPMQAAAGHAAPPGLRRAARLRAPPPPLRVQQRLPRGRSPRPACLQRPVARRPAGRDHRARRTTPGSWPASSTPSSNRGRTGRTRCSGISCGAAVRQKRHRPDGAAAGRAARRDSRHPQPRLTLPSASRVN